MSCFAAQAAPIIRKSLRCICNHLTNLPSEPKTGIRAKDITLLASLLGFSALGVWYLSVSDSPFDKCLQEADKKMEECALFSPDDEACDAQHAYDYEGCKIARDVGFGPRSIR